jgi:hypothetical protein
VAAGARLPGLPSQLAIGAVQEKRNREDRAADRQPRRPAMREGKRRGDPGQQAQRGDVVRRDPVGATARTAGRTMRWTSVLLLIARASDA